MKSISTKNQGDKGANCWWWKGRIFIERNGAKGKFLNDKLSDEQWEEWKQYVVHVTEKLRDEYESSCSIVMLHHTVLLF